jgi:hypothetical protein
MTDHTASKTEDAGIGAAAAGDDADGKAKGQITRQGKKVPRGKGQRIEIFKERPGFCGEDLSVVAKGQPPYLFP